MGDNKQYDYVAKPIVDVFIQEVHGALLLTTQHSRVLKNVC